MIDDVYSNLRFDHHGFNYDESEFMEQLRRVRIEIMEERTVAQSASLNIRRESLVSELEVALHHMMKHTLVVS